MLNLIKSDLYRITRFRTLRGSLWQYGLVCGLVFLLLIGGMWFVSSVMYTSVEVIDVSGGIVSTAEVAGTSGMSVVFRTPIQFLSQIIGGFLPLCASFMAVEHALADFKEGFARTIVSARRGRLSYIVARILFAGVLTAILFVLLSAFLLAVGLAFGFRFEHMDAPGTLIAWIAGVWLNTWALASISLILVYATRVGPVSYIASFFICGSIVPQTLFALAGASSGVLRFLEPVAPVLNELASWMPSNLIDVICADAGAMAGGGAGALMASVPWGLAIQSIVAGVIWTALAGCIICAITRKRDV